MTLHKSIIFKFSKEFRLIASCTYPIILGYLGHTFVIFTHSVKALKEQVGLRFYLHAFRPFGRHLQRLLSKALRPQSRWLKISIDQMTRTLLSKTPVNQRLSSNALLQLNIPGCIIVRNKLSRILAVYGLVTLIEH